MSICRFRQHLITIAEEDIESGRNTHTEAEIRQARLRALVFTIYQFKFKEKYNNNGQGSTYEKMGRIYYEIESATLELGLKGLDWIFQFEKFGDIELTDEQKKRTWSQALNDLDQICPNPQEIHQILELIIGTSVNKDAYAYTCPIKFVSSGQWGVDFIHPCLHVLPQDRARTGSVIYESPLPGSSREPNKLTIGSQHHPNLFTPYKRSRWFESGHLTYNNDGPESNQMSTIQPTYQPHQMVQNSIPNNITTQRLDPSDISALTQQPEPNGGERMDIDQPNPANNQARPSGYDSLFDSSLSSSSSSSSGSSILDQQDTNGMIYIRLANRPADLTGYLVSPERNPPCPVRTLQRIIQQRRSNGYDGEAETTNDSGKEDSEEEVEI